MAARIDGPDLPADENSVLVLKNAGPLGAPGMPEWGQLPIPQKLLAEGVRDMVRISDARMSRTSYGACVLRGAGGVRRRPVGAGPGRRRRRAGHPRPQADAPGRRRGPGAAARHVGAATAAYQRGYGAIFAQHITQANEGCDFDCLERGAPSAPRSTERTAGRRAPWSCPKTPSSARSRPAGSRSACG